ncbi:hypothetical protein [Actinophytocola sediminis]
MTGTDVGPRATLTVLSGTACLALFAVWLFSSGTVALVTGLLGALAGLVLVVVSVVGTIVDHRPGVVLVSLAFLGVGAAVTSVVFGLAYLEESVTYLRGEQTTARITHCERDDGEREDCEASWRADGREHTGEVELSFATRPGQTLPVRAAGDEAVRTGGLTVLVVAASGVAVVSPVAVLVGYVSVRRSRSA